MSQAISSPSDISAPVAPLDGNEDTIFGRIFQRNFVFQNLEKQWNDILIRHQEEIKSAATIAKAQFGLRFGGLIPQASQFGMFLTRAPFFGLKTWELDAGSYLATTTTLADGLSPTAGTTVWISKALLSGTAGDNTIPLVVGRFAVHCIVAIGDFAAAPVIESFQETLNGNIQPFIVAEHQFRNSQLKYVEYDEAEIYKLNTTFLWQYNADLTATSDSPYFFGVSFLPFTQAKTLNPNTFNSQSTVDSVVHF